MITKRTVMLAKIETTYNTDPTPAAATDAFLAVEPKWRLEGLRIHERANITKPSIGMLNSLYGGTLFGLTFGVEVRGSGAAGTAPEYGPLLQACGMSETVVASTSVTYAPASTGIKSVTIYAYLDGKLVKVTGCRGKVTSECEAGKPAMLNFDMVGHFVSETDVALPSQTVDATVPPVFKGATFATDSFSAVISKLSMDTGNTVATPPDVNSADGFGQVQITGRNVTGSFDPEATLKASYDWLGKLQGANTFTIATGTIGGTAGNRFALSIAKAQYVSQAPGDRDGIATYDIGFLAAENSGDDEFSLAFT